MSASGRQEPVKMLIRLDMIPLKNLGQLQQCYEPSVHHFLLKNEFVTANQGDDIHLIWRAKEGVKRVVILNGVHIPELIQLLNEDQSAVEKPGDILAAWLFKSGLLPFSPNEIGRVERLRLKYTGRLKAFERCLKFSIE